MLYLCTKFCLKHMCAYTQAMQKEVKIEIEKKER